MHRYGRHGPHAWLRLQQQHVMIAQALGPSAQPSPLLVVQISVSLEVTERIVVLIMPTPNDDTDVRQEDQLIQEVQSIAERQANRYVKRLMRDISSGKYPIISPQMILEQAQQGFDAYLSEEIDKKRIRLTDQCENQLEQAFLDAFIAKVNQKKQEHPDIFPSDRDIHLHNIALHDKQHNPYRSQSEVDTIAVLRAVQTLDLTIDAALADMSVLLPVAQTYQKYYRTIDADKEAIWDTQGTF
jgi:hypothetical protein